MKSRDAEKLWEAMKLAFPIAAQDGGKNAPEGAAQMAREYAVALFNEWKRATE